MVKFVVSDPTPVGEHRGTSLFLILVEVLDRRIRGEKANPTFLSRGSSVRKLAYPNADFKKFEKKRFINGWPRFGRG